MNPNTQPDYIALAMVAVMAVIVVMVIRKWLSNRAAAKGTAPQPAPTVPTYADGALLTKCNFLF